MCVHMKNITVRELRSNLAKVLKDLPCEIIDGKTKAPLAVLLPPNVYTSMKQTIIDLTNQIQEESPEAPTNKFLMVGKCENCFKMGKLEAKKVPYYDNGEEHMVEKNICERCVRNLGKIYE